MNIITAILCRLEAKHATETHKPMRFEVYRNETWIVTMERPEGGEATVAAGEDFSELPALLSSLK